MKNFKRVLRSSVCFLVIFTMMMTSMVFAINVNNFEVVDFDGEVPYPIPQGERVKVNIMFDGSGNVQTNQDNHITVPNKFTLDANGNISSSLETNTQEFTERNEDLIFEFTLEVDSAVVPDNYYINLRNIDNFSSGEKLINTNLDLIIPFTVIGREDDIATLDIATIAENKTYDGNTDADVTLQYDVGDDDVTVNYTAAYFASSEAGIGIDVTVEGLSLTGEDADKYELESTTLTTTATIFKADADINVEGKTVTYDGEAHGATGSATGVNGENLSDLLDFGESFTNVPGGTTEWSFEGTSNYNEDFGSVFIDIQQASAIINVPDVTVRYDGDSHGVTGSAKGVNNEELTDLMNFGQTFTNVPGGIANWIFDGNDNYEPANGEANVTITEADLIITAISENKIYDGEAFDSFDVTYDGFVEEEDESVLSGELVWEIKDADGESVDEIVNAGTYTIIPSGLNSNNYDIDFVSAEITIQKADANISVNGKTVTYNGDAHGATGTATGVSGEDLSELLDLGETFTNVPGGTAEWSFAGNQNYNEDSDSVEIIIEKAQANIDVDDVTVEYDGKAHRLEGSVIGVKGEDLSEYMDFGQEFTNVPGGTATWTFEGNTNYLSDTGEAQVAITPRYITITADDLSKIYGAEDPELTYSYDEDLLVEGDEFEGGLEREVGEKVGTYVINQGNLSLGDNYDLNFVEGTFSISYGIQGLFPPGSDDEIICFKTGRAIPLKWAYIDANGDVVDSSDFLLQVHFRSVDSEDASEEITTPGNSSLSYNENTGTWQVNWHTKGMDSGVYELIIFDEETGQYDVFYINLK